MTSSTDLVQELATVTGWLAANITRSSRPYRPELSADRKSELKILAMMERREESRSGMLVPLGETPAPADIEILDLLVEILEFAAAWSGLPQPTSSLDDPGPHFRAVIARLRAGRIVDVTAVEDTTETLIDRAHQTLGLVGDGQLLKAVCPWCEGRTEKHPEGGQRTMRIRAKLPDGKRSVVNVNPADIRWLVVCESGTCEPPAKDCGTWWRGRPAWDLRNEDEFLAKRLGVVAS